jgi:hypothetical protein
VSLFALALLVAAPVAPSALTWEAPAGCPTEADVLRAVGAYRVQRPRRAVRAVARVRVAGDRFELAATIDTPDGRTTLDLDDRSCRVLADATALMFALHLDGDASPRPPPAPRRSRLHGHTRLFGGGAVGVVPGLSGLVGLALGLGAGAGRGELAFTHGLERLGETGTPGVGYTVRLWSALVRGCWAPRFGRAEFPLCGDLELGALLGTGAGERVVAARTRPALWLGGGLSAAVVGWVQPNIGLYLEGRAHLALSRPQFTVAGHEGVVYRAPLGGVRLLVGIEVRFAAAPARRSVTNRGRAGD